MNDAVRDAVIETFCRELKLPTVRQDYQDLAREARQADLGMEAYLHLVLEAEVLERRRRSVARRLREAKFPDINTLDQLDYGALSGITRGQLATLATCGFIDAHQTVVIAGPIGTGKTHTAIALGVEAARRQRRVSFVRAADLVRELVEARDERRLLRLGEHYRRVELLIIDELGFVPFSVQEGELLFNLLADRYEKGAVILTTNLTFGQWTQVFQNEKLTVALLDRLTHHSHILTTHGTSYRSQHRQVASPNAAEPEVADVSP